MIGLQSTVVMPQWQCHKKVRASKITKITVTSNRNTLVDAVAARLDDGQWVVLDPAFCAKHAPQAGGYLVQYEDGYLSFSPAKAFEEGYTKIEEGAAE